MEENSWKHVGKFVENCAKLWIIWRNLLQNVKMLVNLRKRIKENFEKRRNDMKFMINKWKLSKTKKENSCEKKKCCKNTKKIWISNILENLWKNKKNRLKLFKKKLVIVVAENCVKNVENQCNCYI